MKAKIFVFLCIAIFSAFCGRISEKEKVNGSKRAPTLFSASKNSARLIFFLRWNILRIFIPLYYLFRRNIFKKNFRRHYFRKKFTVVFQNLCNNSANIVFELFSLKLIRRKKMKIVFRRKKLNIFSPE